MSATESTTLSEAVDEWLAANWDLTLSVREWWCRLADAGYAYPTWPAGVGGLGLPAKQARSVTVVLARHGVVAPPTGHLAANLAAPTILEHGTPAQVEELVRPIAYGEASWCQLFSEPGSGSDLASIGTTAVRDGDEFVVNGQKVWNSAADSADFGMLLTRTEPDQPKHRGMTYFAIDMHQHGVEVRPLRQMNGTTAFCEVFLTDARVRADHMIGAYGAGWRVAQTTLANERGSLVGSGIPGLYAAQSGCGGDLEATVGDIIDRTRTRARVRKGAIRSGAIPARMMLELAREYLRNRDAEIRQELAQYYTQVQVNGWTTRRIAAARGRLTGADGSIAKLATSRICQQSRDLAYRIVGANAMLDGPESPMGGDLQRVGLASPGTRIGGGTDEIQLNVLGEKGLGLPREPGGDQDVPYRELRVGTQRKQ